MVGRQQQIDGTARGKQLAPVLIASSSPAPGQKAAGIFFKAALGYVPAMMAGHSAGNSGASSTHVRLGLECCVGDDSWLVGTPASSVLLCQALFTSHPNPKYFLFHSSHQIF
jgi:hypothetical protein